MGHVVDGMMYRALPSRRRRIRWPVLAVVAANLVLWSGLIAVIRAVF